MTKKELRHIYKEKRLQLSHSQQAKMDDLLLIQFQQLNIEIPSRIMTYSALERMKEFDPSYITDYCHFKNPDQVLLYPVMNEADNTMHAVSTHIDTSFELNKYDIAEPVDGTPVAAADIEMVIVPLLIFDTAGNRAGYGKGYYDRFLSGCSPACIKVGFCYFEPVEAIDDINTLDIKLDYGITPGGIFAF